MMIGASHHAFRTLRKSQSSPRKDLLCDIKREKEVRFINVSLGVTYIWRE